MGGGLVCILCPIEGVDTLVTFVMQRFQNSKWFRRRRAVGFDRESNCPSSSKSSHLEVCKSCMPKVTRVSTLSMGQSIGTHNCKNRHRISQNFTAHVCLTGFRWGGGSMGVHCRPPKAHEARGTGPHERGAHSGFLWTPPPHLNPVNQASPHLVIPWNSRGNDTSTVIIGSSSRHWPIPKTKTRTKRGWMRRCFKMGKQKYTIPLLPEIWWRTDWYPVVKNAKSLLSTSWWAPSCRRYRRPEKIVKRFFWRSQLTQQAKSHDYGVVCNTNTIVKFQTFRVFFQNSVSEFSISLDFEDSVWGHSEEYPLPPLRIRNRFPPGLCDAKTYQNTVGPSTVHFHRLSGHPKDQPVKIYIRDVSRVHSYCIVSRHLCNANFDMDSNGRRRRGPCMLDWIQVP